MTNFVIYKTEFAYFRITYCENSILSIQITEEATDFGIPNLTTENVRMQLEEYFVGIRYKFDLPFLLIGTEFQKKVWNTLSQIPYGETRTYKEIAMMVGNPMAVRAVGAASNKNPMHILLPCHRVVGSNGNLVGYAAGLERKRKLLEMECLYKSKMLNNQ